MNRASIANVSLARFGTERLLALCEAVGAGKEARPLLEVFERLVASCGALQIGDRPRYPSNIADDEAPFEFSIALSDGPPEIQAYVEVQGESPSLRSNMKAGRALLERLAGELGAPLDRLRAIEHAFLPDDPCGPFAIWIGISWTRGQPIRLKVYLNPQVRGTERAPELVSDAMNRLGFEEAWSSVRRSLCQQGKRRDELGILCLDLSSSEHARTKIYIRHHGATVPNVQAIARLAANARPDDIATFYGELAGQEGPFSNKPVLTELAFVDPASPRPSAITLEFPIGAYVESDELARRRILSCMSALAIPSEHYDKAIAALAMQPLRESVGLHAHVTLRHVPRSAALVEARPASVAQAPLDPRHATLRALVPRVAVYFCSGAYPVARRGFER